MSQIGLALTRQITSNFVTAAEYAAAVKASIEIQPDTATKKEAREAHSQTLRRAYADVVKAAISARR